MFRGIAQVTVYADDVAAARRWYAELLGTDAYFARESPDGTLGYVEFRTGDHLDELGIVDGRYRPASATAGPAA